MEEQERAPQTGAEPLSEIDARYAYKRDLSETLEKLYDSEIVPTLPGAWHGFYPAFARAVRGAGPLPVNPRDAVATATVLDAARRSATEGGVVRFTG